MNEELIKRLTRVVFALQDPLPEGSEHYRNGWSDGIDAAIDTIRKELEGDTACPTSSRS